MINLWKYNPITGYWIYQRGCAPGEETAWLKIYIRDEPEADFKFAKRKPKGKPDSPKIIGFDNDDTPLWEGRIPIDQRPKVGETWSNLVGDTVTITGTVDPYGRGFPYIRDRECWVNGTLTTVQVHGQIGQSEVLEGKATRIKG